jgi:ATP-binding cassette subfamily B (MDR/TAP) protein 1
LFLLIDRQSTIDPFDPSGDQPELEAAEVELENVTFAYPTRPGATVLDNFSLKVPAGKTTALVVSWLFLCYEMHKKECIENS